VNGFLINQRNDLPTINDKSSRYRLIRQVFQLGVKNKTLRKPENNLLGWYTIHSAEYEPPPDPPPQMKEIADYATSTYLTVFENNLWMHHESRLLKYLRALYGEASGGLSEDGASMIGPVGEAETLCYLICRHYDTGFKRRAQIAPTLEQSQLINLHRELFGLEDVWGPSGMLSEGKLKKNYTSLLKCSIDFLHTVEEFNATIPPHLSKHLIKQWTVAPMCSRKRHNLTIDTEILMQMMKEVGEIDKKVELNDFWPVASYHFDSIFVVKRPNDSDGRRRHSHGPSKQYVHRCYVQTDGVVLNAQFQPSAQERVKGGNRAKKRKAAENSKGNESTNAEAQSIKSAKSKRAAAKRKEWTHDGVTPDDAIRISIDPGRVNIIYAIRSTDSKVFKLTNRRYQEESGIRYANNRWSKWDTTLQEIYNQIGDNSPKTASTDRWSAFLAVDTANADSIWQVNYSKQSSRLRFHTYCKKKHVLESFVSSFASGLSLDDAEKKRRMVVGYGHARFSPTGRNEMAVPTTNTFKTVSKMWKTKIINENYTSVVCNECHGRLVCVKTDVVVNQDDRSLRKDNRGVHRCTSTCKTLGMSLKNRDLNAAKNIDEILLAELQGHDRPACFTANGAPPRR
jgi:hypothetical protein